MSTNFRASRVLTDVPGGIALWSATFTADDSSHTRMFGTTFEADARLDAKRIAHMTGEVSTEASKKANEFAAIAAGEGLVLEPWQVVFLAQMFAAGPDGGRLIAMRDRRESYVVVPLERRVVV